MAPYRREYRVEWDGSFYRHLNISGAQNTGRLNYPWTLFHALAAGVAWEHAAHELKHNLFIPASASDMANGNNLVRFAVSSNRGLSDEIAAHRGLLAVLAPVLRMEADLSLSAQAEAEEDADAYETEGTPEDAVDWLADLAGQAWQSDEQSLMSTSSDPTGSSDESSAETVDKVPEHVMHGLDHILLKYGKGTKSISTTGRRFQIVTRMMQALRTAPFDAEGIVATSTRAMEIAIDCLARAGLQMGSFAVSYAGGKLVGLMVGQGGIRDLPLKLGPIVGLRYKGHILLPRVFWQALASSMRAAAKFGLAPSKTCLAYYYAAAAALAATSNRKLQFNPLHLVLVMHGFAEMGCLGFATGHRALQSSSTSATDAILEDLMFLANHAQSKPDRVTITTYCASMRYIDLGQMVHAGDDEAVMPVVSEEADLPSAELMMRAALDGAGRFETILGQFEPPFYEQVLKEAFERTFKPIDLVTERPIQAVRLCDIRAGFESRFCHD